MSIEHKITDVLLTRNHRNAGAVILMMTYGYNIMDHNDPFIDIVDKATEQFAVASTPGAFLVDTLPFR